MRFRLLLSRHAASLALIALVGLVWLAPMLADPGHTIIGGEGDNLYYVHQFWWMKHALIDLHRSPFFDPGSYVPLGYSMSRGELTPANTIPGLPITLLAGPIAAYNVMVAVSFLLTGWATYAWVYRLTGSRAGGLVAAVIAEMAPYRLAHAGAHLPLVATQGFPLALWTFEEFFTRTASSPPEKRHASRWAIALGLSLAWTALSSWYYGYSLALMFPIYVVLRTRGRWGVWRARQWWGGLVLAGVVAGALVAPFAVPYVRASLSGTLQRSFEEMDGWSLTPYDFVIPNVTQPLWNGAMKTAFPQEARDWVERSVSLGYAALALAAIPLLRRRRSASAPVLALTAVALASALVALGPLLHWHTRHVLVPVPAFASGALDRVFSHLRPDGLLRAQLRTQHVTLVPLPSLVLFRFVPGAAGMRVMARFGYWTLLMVAGLAGLGVRELLDGSWGLTRRAASVIVAVALAGVVFESWSQKETSRWEPRPVDQWIARQAPEEVVAEVPLHDVPRPAIDYFATIQQHPSVLGPRGDSFPPAALYDRITVLSGFPSAQSLAAMRGWGTTLVIVDTGAVPEWPSWQKALSVMPGVHEAAEFGDVRVYRVDKQ